MNKILALHVLLIFTFAVPVSHAGDIEEVLPNGLVAEANYYPGDSNKPAILLIHGFLTVHNFNLIQSLASEIAGNQYAVLTPTLTLGISKRRTTLDCNALHLHSMEDDIKEIEWWVNWLIGKGYKKIILMGHSSGAVQIVNYASIYKHKELTRLIALSIVPLSVHNNSHATGSRKKALKLIENNDTDIHNFTLTYCIENYSAPAAQYLSYAQWDSARILKSLRAIHLPRQAIMGSLDISKSFDLTDAIEKTDTRVDIIEGADHFFGSGTELELYDVIMQGITENQ